MTWNGQIIVDIERRFLDTNGVRVVVDANVVDSQVDMPEQRITSAATLESDTVNILSDLNHASQKVYKLSLIAQLVVQQLITRLVVVIKSHQQKVQFKNFLFKTV